MWKNRVVAFLVIFLCIVATGTASAEVVVRTPLEAGDVEPLRTLEAESSAQLEGIHAGEIGAWGVVGVVLGVLLILGAIASAGSGTA